MQFQIGLPIKFFFSQDAIIFYLLGGMIGKYHFDSFTQKATTKEIIGAVMAIAAIILLFLAEYFQLFQLPVFLKTVMLACYCIAFWRAADLWVDRLPSGRYIEYSFLIYAMHVNVSAVITKICYLLFPRSSIFAIPNFVVTTVLTVVCICVFAAVLQRRFPRIYRVAVGSR